MYAIRSYYEFVSEFAQPMPQMVMANILGWPISDLKLLDDRRVSGQAHARFVREARSLAKLSHPNIRNNFV